MKSICILLSLIYLIHIPIGCDQTKSTTGSARDSTITTSGNTSGNGVINTDSPLNTARPHEAIVGNDKDIHGCVASAGYTWSVLKNDCVQLFKSAIRLNDNGAGATLSAFVIFSKNKKQAEIFLPGSKESLMLIQKMENDDETWQATNLKLYTWKGGYLLDKDGKQAYAGHPGDN